MRRIVTTIICVLFIISVKASNKNNALDRTNEHELFSVYCRTVQQEKSGSIRTIHVETAGTLPEYISESEKYTIEKLTLTGKLNGTDFRLLRDMAGCNYLGDDTNGKLTVLDISGAKIVAGGKSYIDTDHFPGYGSLKFQFYIEKSDELPNNLFHSCRKLTSIIIPNSVTSIGGGTFEDCSGLISLTIPKSVTSIELYAFEGCSGLTSIKVEDGNFVFDSRNNCNAIIRTSDNVLIAGCKNTVIPNSVTSIGIGAFEGCSGLTSITIPNSITSIKASAFENCSNLTSVTIPNSVTSLGDYAFWFCSSLLNVISKIKKPFDISGWVFMVNSSMTLTVPKGTKAAYKSKIYWNEFKNIVESTSDDDDNDQEQKVTVTAMDYTREYGDANPNYMFTSSGATLNGTPEITCSATRTSPVGTYPIKISKGSISNNNVTYVDGTLTITEAPLTITAKSYTREEGTDNPTLEATYNGFKNGESQSVLTQKPKITTNATSSSAPGVYDIIVSDADAQNYTISYVWGTLTITEKKEVTFSYQGITYLGTNASKTAEVRSVDTDILNLEIPSEVTHDGKIYQVTSIANNALKNRQFNYVSLPSTVTSLASSVFYNCTIGALIWNASDYLSQDVFNNMAMSTKSNFLLYVKSKSYAPSNVKNVIVNGSASEIVLEDTTNTIFYCPKEFTTRKVSYTHHYGMTTDNKGKGCETIALPFKVQKIEHASKGELTPFANYDSNYTTQHSFWLFELGNNGFSLTDTIFANTPYIISLPNNPNYDEEYSLAGDVTFSSMDAKIVSTESVVIVSTDSENFIPTFSVIERSSEVYALNVNNYLVSNNSSYDSGSMFISNLRKVYPFEAYLTTNSPNVSQVMSMVFEDETEGIGEIIVTKCKEARVKVYSLSGQMVIDSDSADFDELRKQLPSGVYVVNGKKIIK